MGWRMNHFYFAFILQYMRKHWTYVGYLMWRSKASRHRPTESQNEQMNCLPVWVEVLASCRTVAISIFASASVERFVTMIERRERNPIISPVKKNKWGVKCLILQCFLSNMWKTRDVTNISQHPTWATWEIPLKDFFYLIWLVAPKRFIITIIIIIFPFAVDSLSPTQVFSLNTR